MHLYLMHFYLMHLYVVRMMCQSYYKRLAVDVCSSSSITTLEGATRQVAELRACNKNKRDKY